MVGILVLLTFPLILIVDLYLTPWRIPSTVIYAIPIMVSSRLFAKIPATIVLLVGIGFQTLDAVIENQEFGTIVLEILSLLVIGIISLYWSLAERRSAFLAVEISHLFEQEKARSSELEESQKRLLEFFSLVAHDLRNPITVIITSSELLQKGEKLSMEQRDKMIAGINSSGRRIARLADDLLDASRIGAGRFEINKTKIDIVHLARGIVQQRQFTTTNLQIEMEAVPEIIEGWWDEVRIAQALSNIIDNAIKYSPGGGQIHVAVFQTDGRVRLMISDQGVGIAQEDIPLLFQPYSRLHRTRDIKGVGLGLFITRGIVEAHRGSIEVQSELGKGSTFTIELPIESPSS